MGGVLQPAACALCSRRVGLQLTSKLWKGTVQQANTWQGWVQISLMLARMRMCKCHSPLEHAKQVLTQHSCGMC